VHSHRKPEGLHDLHRSLSASQSPRTVCGLSLWSAHRDELGEGQE
jgi:hypothetical protein